MPQYLKIAEEKYIKMAKKKKGFTDDPMEDLNNLMIELRQEIKGTKLKLLYNYIDFAEILGVKPLQESKIKLDLSLIPKVKILRSLYFGLLVLLSELPQVDKKNYLQFELKLLYPPMPMKKLTLRRKSL